MRMLVTGVLTILIGVGVLFLLAYSSSIYLAYRSSIPLAADFSRKKQRAQVFWTAVVLLAIILVAFLPRIPLLFFREEAGSLFAPSIVIYLFYLFYLAYPAYRFIKFPHNPVNSRSQFIFLIIGTLALTFGWGVYDNKAALKEQSRFVTVVLNKDFAQAATHPLNSALLLGTTSRFHFFYVDKCEDTQTADKDSKTGNVSNNEKTKTNEKAPECKNGRPFIIPTANIAALEFIDTKESGPGPEQVGLPDILASINQLNETISALKFDATINMQSGKVIFDTKAVADAIAKVDSTVTAINKSNETNTNQIAEAIKSLNPLIVEPNPHWKGLIGALTTLNQTVSTLKPPVVSNPGSNDLTSALTALTKAIESFKAVANPDPKTAAAVTALNATLRTLNETIASLNIPGAGNLCASGWRKVATIGPFPIGDHDQLEETARECQNQLIPPDQFGNETNGRFTDRQLLLIGRVDITQLSEQARKDYGSDSGLAQARAKWVRDKLVERSQNTEQKEALRRAILLSAGPLHVGENVSNCDRALDRSVEVWACR